eukprot:TRINITY_DN10157_c0_g1_i1.p1 TRINITY_DN10157_c0_g1~~TRINITY_DN10157_c0_g1_i1.p1  ORF type:complete len:234 (+),score=53.32 TRINITY_DN10157_c0_g1_i1:60-704(+)
MLVPCQAAEAACRAADGCINGCSHGMQACLFPSTMPSPLFVIFSVIVNAVMIVCCAVGPSASQDVPEADCGSGKTWLRVGTAVAAGNILFAVYLYWRFSRLANSLVGTGSAQRAVWKIFMYDVGVFVYLLFGVFVVVWLAVANSREDEGCGGINDYLGFAQACVWCYGIGGFFVLVCTVCTECCSTPRYMQQHHAQLSSGPPHAAPLRARAAPA